jgi:light-regulated signal transduction histidine kinase (bacteriophytochrome)
MGGFHDARNGMPERSNAVSAARTLLAIHHRAPAATSSARTCFCDLLAQLVEMQMDMQEMRSALDREALTRMSRSSYDRDREERLADVVERLRGRVEALEKAKQ